MKTDRGARKHYGFVIYENGQIMYLGSVFVVGFNKHITYSIIQYIMNLQHFIVQATRPVTP
jgi:hypothetical protein